MSVAANASIGRAHKPVGVEHASGVAAEQRDALRQPAGLVQGDDGKGAAAAGLPVDGEIVWVDLDEVGVPGIVGDAQVIVAVLLLGSEKRRNRGMEGEEEKGRGERWGDGCMEAGKRTPFAFRVQRRVLFGQSALRTWAGRRKRTVFGRAHEAAGHDERRARGRERKRGIRSSGSSSNKAGGSAGGG